jgi:hypothetical protein
MEPPYTITVTWAVGDSLVVSHPELQPWEARAALEAAIEAVIDADEDEDAEEKEEP